MLRYAITRGDSCSEGPGSCADAVVREAARWAEEGVDFVQVREKDLGAGELAGLVRRVLDAVRGNGGRTRVLVNSRVDVAMATGADGVHLVSGGASGVSGGASRVEVGGSAPPAGGWRDGGAGELTAEQVRSVYRTAGLGTPAMSVSCHTVEEVARAVGWGVEAILFGPVFGKTVDGVEVVPGVGLERLREACVAAGVKNGTGSGVFALGGITVERAAACIDVGAVGVAGIRLFGLRSREV